MVVKLVHKSASVTLRPTPENTVWVANLYAQERRQGHAKELMQQVCEKADAQSVTLQLDARQYGHPLGMNTGELILFYESFGFEHVPAIGKHLMQRPPSQEKQPL